MQALFIYICVELLGNGTLSYNASSLGPLEGGSCMNCTTPDCGEGFYFDEEETRSCRPICGEFLFKSNVLKQVVFSVGFLFSVLTLILAFLQRDTL